MATATKPRLCETRVEKGGYVQMTDAPGLRWVKSTDTYTRLGALSGMTLAQAIAYSNVTPPWGQMRRCNLLDNGVVSAWYNDGAGCYSDTDVATMGQCMVDIECFDYYTDFSTAGTYIWYIQPHGAGMTVGGSAVTWKTHPAFVRNGVTKDRIFLGAYEAYINTSSASKLESKLGVAPTVIKTIDNFRTAARLRVPGGSAANVWEVQDYLTTCAVQLLYLIEYGNFNSQSLTLGISPGICAVASFQNTGATAAYGNTSYGAPGRATAMSYRGIENLWGNTCTLVDGINTKATTMVPWIADHDFATNNTASYPYIESDLAPYTTQVNFSGCGADFKMSATYDYGFICSAVNADTINGGTCDVYANSTSTASGVLCYGGACNASYYAGAFYMLFRMYTYTAAEYSSRLMYIG